MARRQAKFATCFLLQCAGSKRSFWRRPVWLVFHAAHDEIYIFEASDNLCSTIGIENEYFWTNNAHIVEIFSGCNTGAIKRQQLCSKGWCCVCVCFKREVIGRTELDALVLSLNNQSQGRALYAACRKSTVNAAPQYGRHFVSVETIENASSFSSVN